MALLKQTFKQILSLTLILNILIFTGYSIFEPQSVEAVEDQIQIFQSVTAEISITSPSDVTMSPAIPGMTGSGGTPSTGQATWTVITNNKEGFTMTFKASTSPALRGNTTNDYFADYTPSNPSVPDYNWSIAANAAEFGYTVEPATAADTAQLFKDNGSACNTGSNQTADKCWYSASTTAVTVINRTSSTSSSGENEVIKFRAEQGSNTFKLEDTYTATTTVTVTMN